jgi:hypothetical protein
MTNKKVWFITGAGLSTERPPHSRCRWRCAYGHSISGGITVITKAEGRVEILPGFRK